MKASEAPRDATWTTAGGHAQVLAEKLADGQLALFVGAFRPKGPYGSVWIPWGQHQLPRIQGTLARPLLIGGCDANRIHRARQHGRTDRPGSHEGEALTRSRPGLEMSLPLDGARVLELARFQTGPRGGMLLSDLGAEVLKREAIGDEETRRHPPIVRGQSVYFTVYNRGKKRVCLDLRHPRGEEVFAALVPKADIVLENFCTS